MAVKDSSVTEDNDLHKRKPAEKIADDNAAAQIPSEEIKNAHASGDGSYGRSDGSLPEESEVEEKAKVKKDGSNY